MTAWDKRNETKHPIPTVAADAFDKTVYNDKYSNVTNRHEGTAPIEKWDVNGRLSLNGRYATVSSVLHTSLQDVRFSTKSPPSSTIVKCTHTVGDFIKLPPRSIRPTVDLPFIGVVVAKSGSGRTGRTHLRSVELADDTIRQFNTDSIDAHATQVAHLADKHTREQYAYATGQDVNVVQDVPGDVIAKAFHPQSEANVIAWARAEHDTDGAYDVFVDTDDTSVKEFEAPPAERVSSVEGLIRSLGAAAQDNLNQDVYTDPQNDRQAEKSEFYKEWTDARRLEIDALVKNKVLTPAGQGGGDRPPRAKVLSMKWVYKKKPEKFKARLVIRGFTQKEGDGTFDPDMVFSPTAHGPSVRLLLAIAVQQGRTVGQFDVSNAFQQGIFLAGEIIYVRMPAISGGGVRKLLAPLYGLKQSARSFLEKIASELHQLGFRRAVYEGCLYTYEEVDAAGVTQRLDILLHVDDGLYSTTSKELKDRKFRELRKEIEFTDEHTLSTYLGVHYNYDAEKGICTASSEDYFRRSFTRLHLDFMLKPEFRPSCRDIPFDPAINLCEDESDELYEEGKCPINMRVIVGVLSYAASTTRPDLSYIVNVLASCVSKPRPKHVKAAYHVLAYIAGTLDLGIIYSRKKVAGDDDWRLEAFCDADWASNTVTRRSRTGVILMMAGAPIIWKSHMQATISLSTTEAEYNALVYMGCEILYFFRLLSDLGQRAIVQGSKGDGDRAMAIRCDNKSTIAISTNPFNMRRTRHIEIRHKKVIEWVKAKLIKLVFVPSEENISDIFTKASRRAVFLQNRDVFMSRVQLAKEPTIIEKGLVSYDAGGFIKPAGVKPAVSAVAVQQETSMSTIMSHLYNNMT
jgi:hypothetical protein